MSTPFVLALAALYLAYLVWSRRRLGALAGAPAVRRTLYAGGAVVCLAMVGGVFVVTRSLGGAPILSADALAGPVTGLELVATAGLALETAFAVDLLTAVTVRLDPTYGRRPRWLRRR